MQELHKHRRTEISRNTLNGLKPISPKDVWGLRSYIGYRYFQAIVRLDTTLQFTGCLEFLLMVLAFMQLTIGVFKLGSVNMQRAREPDNLRNCGCHEWTLCTRQTRNETKYCYKWYLQILWRWEGIDICKKTFTACDPSYLK